MNNTTIPDWFICETLQMIGEFFLLFVELPFDELQSFIVELESSSNTDYLDYDRN